MSLLFALLAALSNAVNVITQHVASTSDPSKSKGWRFVWYLLSNPLWLFGGAALIGAFIFQAVALHIGSLSIVQTLLMTELVFSLVLRRFWVRQSVSLQSWTAAIVTCVAVSVFIVAAEPQGGHADAKFESLGRDHHRVYRCCWGAGPTRYQGLTESSCRFTRHFVIRDLGS